MQQSRLSKTVAALREWVKNPVPDRPLRQAGMELLRLASEFADSLPKREADLLQERAVQYDRTIRSPYFQSMCDFARYEAVNLWRSPAGKATLPVQEYGDGTLLPDDVGASADQVTIWRSLLERQTDEPEEQPLDQSHISTSRDDRSGKVGEAPTANSAIVDLGEFNNPRPGVVIGHDLRGFIFRMERIVAFFRVRTNAEETPATRWSLKWFRRLISYFSGILSWADSGHLRGSFNLNGCHVSLQGPDPLHMSRFNAEWLITDLEDAGRVILAAAENLASIVEAEASETASSPPPSVI